LDCANVNVENIFPDDDLTNIIISVEGVELHVHKETMCSLSPVFMAMLCGNFVESKNRRIELPGKKAADVILFLSFFYPPRKFPLKEYRFLQSSFIMRRISYRMVEERYY